MEEKRIACKLAKEEQCEFMTNQAIKVQEEKKTQDAVNAKVAQILQQQAAQQQAEMQQKMMNSTEGKLMNSLMAGC